jgi:formylglycine-generating enzyme required for sulfatase activity/outer membrane protein assembly factor BamB
VGLVVPLPPGQQRSIRIPLGDSWVKEGALRETATLPVLTPGKHTVRVAFRPNLNLASGQLALVPGTGAVSNPVEIEIQAAAAPPARVKEGRNVIRAVPGTYTVALPNGLTVEVVGVCGNPRHQHTWWKPDGSPLAEQPADRLLVAGSLVGTPENEIALLVRQFSTSGDCWVVEKDGEIASLVRQFSTRPDNRPVDTGREPRPGEPPVRVTHGVVPAPLWSAGKVDLYRDGKKLSETAQAVAFRELPETMRYRCGVSWGDWEPVAVFDGKQTKPCTPGASPRFYDLKQDGGRVQVRCEYEADENYHVRFMAILEGGNGVELPICEQWGTVGVTVGKALGMPGPLREILMMRRRCVWGEIDGIALKPQTKTADRPLQAAQPPRELILDLSNGVSMSLVLIPSGTFMMGSPKDEKDRSDNEGPRHQVRFRKPFYMGIHAVTQQQYEQVMGENPSHFKNANHPVEKASWYDAAEFCKRLSQKTGRTVRLPTEAEWEYACRAGSTTRFYFGNEADDKMLAAYAWFLESSQPSTHPVGQKRPNAWGLYDMHGNVEQWCSDWFGPYEDKAVADPAGPALGTERIYRGGSFAGHPQRSASRGYRDSDTREWSIGFRVVVAPTPAGAVSAAVPAAAVFLRALAAGRFDEATTLATADYAKHKIDWEKNCAKVDLSKAEIGEAWASPDRCYAVAVNIINSRKPGRPAGRLAIKLVREGTKWLVEQVDDTSAASIEQFKKSCPDAKPLPVTAGASAAVPAADLAAPRWWFRAAAEHAANIPPPAQAGLSPADRKLHVDILNNILQLQVETGDVEGAVAAAKFAPRWLAYIAGRQARLGDAKGALATAALISGGREKQNIPWAIADRLIAAGKLADARRVLNDQPGSWLTGDLYLRLAQAQAREGDVAAARASIKEIADAPAGDGLNDLRRAEAHVAIAAAQARAGDRRAYRDSLAAARQLTQGLRAPYPDNMRLAIAHAQADAGDYEAAAETLDAMDPKDRARCRDLVLAAQVQRGDVPPAQALAKASAEPGYSPVYQAAMEAQLAAKDHKAAAETLKIAQGHDFYYSNLPARIIDAFLAAADLDGAAGFVQGLSDPVMRTQLYGHIAAERAAGGDRPGYQTIIAKAVASAAEVVDPPPGRAARRPPKREVLVNLAHVQAVANDFEGAKRSVALIDPPENRRMHELELRARELVAGGRLEEARAWVASLSDAEDRAHACLAAAVQLSPTPKRPERDELGNKSGRSESIKRSGPIANSADSPSKEEYAKSWPRFRGPDGSGISAYANVPVAWNGQTGDGIAWKSPVPLEGKGSPVVWKDRVFLSGADEQSREVFCFDAANDGKLLWRQKVPGTQASTARPPKVLKDTGYAASTVATDGRRVFAIFANGDVAAFEFDGTLAWARSLGMPENPYGHASSPATWRNLLLIQFDQGSAKAGLSSLMALDVASGSTAWQSPRPAPSSWPTPIVIENKGREMVITCGDPWVIAYSPADGKEIWRADCLRGDIGPSPVFADGIVYAVNQSPSMSAIGAEGAGNVGKQRRARKSPPGESAIGADGQADAGKSNVLWTADDNLPDTCSPLATRQYVFLLTSHGMLACYDAKSGKKLWEKQFAGDFKSSPGMAGNLVYLVNVKGTAWVVEPGPSDCKLVGTASLGEGCVSSPAFQDGRIYLRGEHNLFAIGQRRPPASGGRDTESQGFVEVRESPEENNVLLKDYRGAVVLPAELRRTYAELVAAFQAGKQTEIEDFCLPGKIKFTVNPRPKSQEEYGQEINLPFLKAGFHKSVLNLRKDGDTEYLIRTGSTALWFLRTEEGKWKLSKYLDKPIQ